VSDLTRRQQAIYEFIVQQVHARGLPPTLMEIAGAFGLRSPAGVSDHLKAIERKGFIRRRPGVSRGIEVRRGAHGPAERPSQARSVPLIGTVPGDKGVDRLAATRIAIDSRWANADSVAFEVATTALETIGIYAGDIVVTDPSNGVRPDDLVIGRQGNSVAILRIEPDSATAVPVAGHIDPSVDVRAYGRVATIIRATPAGRVSRPGRS
jgi:repressor LexA